MPASEPEHHVLLLTSQQIDALLTALIQAQHALVDAPPYDPNSTFSRQMKYLQKTWGALEVYLEQFSPHSCKLGYH